MVRPSDSSLPPVNGTPSLPSDSGAAARPLPRRPPVAPPKQRRNWPAPKPAPPPQGRDIRSFLSELGSSQQGSSSNSPSPSPMEEESLEENFLRHTRQYSSKEVEEFMKTLPAASLARYLLEMLNRFCVHQYSFLDLDDFSIGLHQLFGEVSTSYMGCLSQLGVTWGDALKKVRYSLNQWTNLVEDAKRHNKPVSRVSLLAPTSFYIADIGDRQPLPNSSHTTKSLRARLPTSDPVEDGNYHQRPTSPASAASRLPLRASPATGLSPRAARDGSRATLVTSVCVPGDERLGSNGNGNCSTLSVSDVVMQVSQQSSANTQDSQGSAGRKTGGSLSSSQRSIVRQKKAIGKGLPITGFFPKSGWTPSPGPASSGEDEDIVSTVRDPPHIRSVVHSSQLLPRPIAQMATPSGPLFPIFQRPARPPAGVVPVSTLAGSSPGVPSSAESARLDPP